MNISTSTFGVRRRKATQKNLDQEENAAELKFGPEFQETQITHNGNVESLVALNSSEARLLIRMNLNARRNDMRREQGETVDQSEYDSCDNLDDETLLNVALAPQANEVLRKTLDYLASFARFSDDKTVAAADGILKAEENQELHPFEVAQLGSLDLEESDEAFSLIPSLTNKKSKREIQNLLDELNRLERPY